mgnify:CR=1 FL=1
MKKALITGITGQDGSYLAEFLLEKGYEVHGIVRRASISNTARIDHLIEKNAITLHDGDLTDSSGLIRLVGEIKPDEIYNLAAQSHVQVSFDAPEYSGDVDALGVLRVLEAVRVCGLTKTCKVYQASTSELYGKVEEIPQRETTPFHPYSPYAVAKQYGFWMVKEYRDAYGMFAVNGILFNHESERRGENFVTRKITLAAGRIAEGLQDHLELGNMDSLRDWGYAKDYVECMWLIMQQDKPEDFVIATGVQHTVRDFTEKDTSTLSDFLEGVKYFKQHIFLGRLILFYLLFYFFMSAPAFLTPVLVNLKFSSSVNALAINEFVWSLGTMLGGILICSFKEFNKLKFMAISALLFGGFICLLGASNIFSIYILFMLCSGISLPLFNTSNTVLIQENVKKEMLGRVFANLNILSTISTTIGITVFGIIGNTISVDILLILVGAFIAILSIWIWKIYRENKV